MAERVRPRPFVKWAGGKAQLTAELLKRTPAFNTYLEPFVGGGAFFFALYREKRIKRAYLADLNQDLIDAYVAIRDEVSAVIEILAGYPHDKTFFYDIRAQDPAELNLAERAARLIYLNRTCYNGLYRVNRQGKFNVPFGSYKSPTICDARNLRAVSKALQKVEIQCTSFENVVQKAQKGDLVYFDPPYEPISRTSNFTSYQATGFTKESQKKLLQVCQELTHRQVQFMLSNSSAELIRELYRHNGFSIHEVQAKRAINSNPRKRGKLTELIVTNCSPEPSD
ncbi:MAG: DNA adenine methylase [bacterium]